MIILFVWVMLKVFNTYYEGLSSTSDSTAKVSGKYNSEFFLY